MPSEAIAVPASPPTTAAGPARSGPPPRSLQPPTLAAEARLAAELAEERHVALELQRAILPLHDEPFDLPGLRTMVRYLPASKAGRVGGDWYITADMPGGHVLIAIGDVAGHGLAAAAGMAPLRCAAAGPAIHRPPPPGLVGPPHHLRPPAAGPATRP